MAENAINNNINEENQVDAVTQQKKQPDEQSGIYIQGHVKIFDPETDEVFMNGRA